MVDDSSYSIHSHEYTPLPPPPYRTVRSFMKKTNTKNKNMKKNEKQKLYPPRRGLTESFFKMGLTDRVPGVLEFDFVSVGRPPADARYHLTPAQFDR